MFIFKNLFSAGNPSNSEIKATKSLYREWDKQRRKAEAFGSHHVAEIDAIFSRALSHNK